MFGKKKFFHVGKRSVVLLAAGLVVCPAKVFAQTYLMIGAGGNGGAGYLSAGVGRLNDGGGGGIGGGGGGGLYGGGGGGVFGPQILWSQGGGATSTGNFHGVGSGGGGAGGYIINESYGTGGIGSFPVAGFRQPQQFGAPSSGTLNATTNDYTLNVSSGSETYADGGIGGGGGGGSGYNYLKSLGNSGSNGANGQLTMSGSSAITITPSSTGYFAVGGAGGGAGNIGAGGNGGDGSVIMTDSSALTSPYISVGGSGGGGTNANNGQTGFLFWQILYGLGNVGGAGGKGTFVMNGSSHLNATTLLTLGGMGGGGGGTGAAGTGGGNAGDGSLVVRDSASVSAKSIWIGGDTGIGLLGGFNPGQGGNGTLTVIGPSASVYVQDLMRLGGKSLGTGPASPPANTPRAGNGAFYLENGGHLVLADGAVVEVVPHAANPSLDGTATFGISGVGNIDVEGNNTATISVGVSDIPGDSPGVLTKNGTGTLILTGVNTYTGGTRINGGILQIGMLTNFIQTEIRRLAVFITPDLTPGIGYGQLRVEGGTKIGGILAVYVTPSTKGYGYAIGSVYRVISSTSGQPIVGTFSDVNMIGTSSEYLTPSLSYSSNAVDLELLASQKAIDSGSFYASNGYVQNASLFNILSVPMQTGKGYWMHGIGNFGHAPGTNYDYKGFVVGLGFSVNPKLVIGGAISNVYTHSTGENGSNVDGTSVGAEVYGIYTLRKYTFTSIATAGHLGSNATRYLPGVGTGKFNLNGSYQGISFRSEYNGLHLGSAFLTPHAQVSYLHTHMGRGQDTGLGTMDMKYGQVDTNLAQAGAGLTLGHKSGMLTPWVSIGVLGTLGNTHSRVNEIIGPQTASVTGQVAPTLAFTPAAGIQLAGEKSAWKLSLDWNGQFSKHTSGQAFALNGSYKF